MEINFLVALVHGFPPPESGFPKSRKMARERPTRRSAVYLSPEIFSSPVYQWYSGIVANVAVEQAPFRHDLRPPLSSKLRTESECTRWWVGKCPLKQDYWRRTL